MLSKTKIYFHEASKIEVKVDKVDIGEGDTASFYNVLSVEVTSPDGEYQKIDVFGVRNSPIETVGVER
jgi:hypothetical protein